VMTSSVSSSEIVMGTLKSTAYPLCQTKTPNCWERSGVLKNGGLAANE
jgi:hypothetical protein